jgi:hypothetical protein
VHLKLWAKPYILRLFLSKDVSNRYLVDREIRLRAGQDDYVVSTLDGLTFFKSLAVTGVPGPFEGDKCNPKPLFSDKCGIF